MRESLIYYYYYYIKVFLHISAFSAFSAIHTDTILIVQADPQSFVGPIRMTSVKMAVKAETCRKENNVFVTHAFICIFVWSVTGNARRINKRLFYERNICSCFWLSVTTAPYILISWYKPTLPLSLNICQRIRGHKQD